MVGYLGLVVVLEWQGGRLATGVSGDVCWSCRSGIVLDASRCPDQLLQGRAVAASTFSAGPNAKGCRLLQG